MKKNVLLCMLCWACSMVYGQVYNESNSLVRKALVLYTKDSKGFYHQQENVTLPFVSGIVDNYAYDKKSHELYVVTANENVVITVANDYAKFLKKNKSIPQLKGEELATAISRENMKLEEKFKRLNHERQKSIEDSIAKAKIDSIAKAREDSIRLAGLARMKENYRKAHDWRWVPVNKASFKCSLCDKSIVSKDSLFCIGFRNDTLLNLTWESLALEVNYPQIHKLHVPPITKENTDFRYHFEVYGDSLRNNAEKISDIKMTNDILLLDAIEKVEKIAPYGYFNDWGWDEEYGSISFYFKYTNTNKSTIKYIDVYWKVTNDVNDVRKTGHFKGTGPLEQWGTASWDWDYSSYYVAGDATNMKITKVIITYTNGSQKTLTGSMIKYD